ncbi:hypothetical protein GCM10027063_40500 [Promicromonospora xylanilytica]
MSTLNKHVWHDAVMTAGIGDAQALAIAGYLFFRHNSKTGDAFPSLALMAKDLGVDESTVRRWVRKLEAFGFATHKRGGTGTSNRYYLTMPEKVTEPEVAKASLPDAGYYQAPKHDWPIAKDQGPDAPGPLILMPTDADIEAFLTEPASQAIAQDVEREGVRALIGDWVQAGRDTTGVVDGLQLILDFDSTITPGKAAALRSAIAHYSAQMAA